MNSHDTIANIHNSIANKRDFIMRCYCHVIANIHDNIMPNIVNIHDNITNISDVSQLLAMFCELSRCFVNIRDNNIFLMSNPDFRTLEIS